jgi:CRP-like cAMP-binding protein
MSQPEPPDRDDRQRDALDWLHAEGRRFATQGPKFDPEGTLAAVRRRVESFWEILGRAEQDQFRARSVQRTFAPGARLMEEGEAADHVLVILEGRVTISTRAGDGSERVIAERGPGELIGEHAVQRPGLRSATVVARTQVQVLAMKAEDFDEFLRTNPSVARPQAKPT